MIICHGCVEDIHENAPICSHCGAPQSHFRTLDDNKSMVEWYVKALTKYATFQGRTRRKAYWYFLLFSFIINVTAQAADRRIFETDSSGNRKYDKPSYTITDNGRIYETDSSGNHKYNGQHFRIDGSRILPTDSSGNRLYNLPSRAISTNGQIYETDSSGNRRYDGQNYKLDGNKIIPTDSSGNRQYDKPQFQIR